jgi:hypothetical protein
MENNKLPKMLELQVRQLLTYRNDQYDKVGLDDMRKELLARIKHYKIQKAEFLVRENDRKELQKWATENNIKLEQNGK